MRRYCYQPLHEEMMPLPAERGHCADKRHAERWRLLSRVSENRPASHDGRARCTPLLTPKLCFLLRAPTGSVTAFRRPRASLELHTMAEARWPQLSYRRRYQHTPAGLQRFACRRLLMMITPRQYQMHTIVDKRRMQAGAHATARPHDD